MYHSHVREVEVVFDVDMCITDKWLTQKKEEEEKKKIITVK